MYPHLKKPKKCPKPKLSFYKIFNYMGYPLRIGTVINSLRRKGQQVFVIMAGWELTQNT